ncbi:MAG: TetR/AcrR family transcriptional regulator [Acidobacteriota bacterium]
MRQESLKRRERGGRAPAPADARVRLLRAALEVFQAKGYAAATVREIVEAAGVTKPVLYYHFRSKEGIYLALMEPGMAEFEALLREHGGRRGPARQRIEALCLDAWRLFKQHLPLIRVMYAIYYGPPQGAPFLDFDRLHLAFQDLLKRLLVEGREGGEFHFSRTEDAMWALIGVVNVAQEVELCHPEMAMGERDFRRTLGLVLGALAAPPAEPPPRRKTKGVTR